MECIVFELFVVLSMMTRWLESQKQSCCVKLVYIVSILVCVVLCKILFLMKDKRKRRQCMAFLFSTLLISFKFRWGRGDDN
jgi:cytochrome bd-type quinol oxidase subunit 2